MQLTAKATSESFPATIFSNSGIQIEFNGMCQNQGEGPIRQTKFVMIRENELLSNKHSIEREFYNEMIEWRSQTCLAANYDSSSRSLYGNWSISAYINFLNSYRTFWYSPRKSIVIDTLSIEADDCHHVSYFPSTIFDALCDRMESVALQ